MSVQFADCEPEKSLEHMQLPKNGFHDRVQAWGLIDLEACPIFMCQLAVRPLEGPPAMSPGAHRPGPNGCRLGPNI